MKLVFATERNNNRFIKITYTDGDYTSTRINGSNDEIIQHYKSYNNIAVLSPKENKPIAKIDFYDKSNLKIVNTVYII